jgi:hypothetical protein
MPPNLRCKELKTQNGKRHPKDSSSQRNVCVEYDEEFDKNKKCSNKLTIALGGGLAGSKPKSGGRFCPLMYLVKNTFFPFKSVART